MDGVLVLIVVLTAVASALLLKWMLPVLRCGLPDLPNRRSSHEKIIPRGGGIVFVLISASVSLVCAPSVGGVAWLPALALPLSAIGLTDDRLNISALPRFVVQLATAFALLHISTAVASWHLPTALFPLVLISIVAVINFTNFMDGLDGLVSGCYLIMLCTSVITLYGASNSSTRLLPIVALIGALIGFFLTNWSPAKVFMGDVGSTFLGAVFSGIVLQVPSWPEALGLVLVATPMIGDACLCIVRRFLAGQHVLQSHRLHLYQRLHQAGWSHAHVAGLYMSATATLAVAFLMGGFPSVAAAACFVVIAGIWLDQKQSVLFSVASARDDG